MAQRGRLPGPAALSVPRPRKDVPHRCSTHFDAVAQIRGEAFFFKGNPGRVWAMGGEAALGPRPTTGSHTPVLPGKYFWRLTRDRHLVSLQPAQVHRFWRGLPLHLDSVDAVYERASDHKIIFFKGGRPHLAAPPAPGAWVLWFAASTGPERICLRPAGVFTEHLLCPTCAVRLCRDPGQDTQSLALRGHMINALK